MEPRAGRDPRVRGGGHGGQRARQGQQLHRPLAQAFTPRHPNLGEKPNHEPLSARGRINLTSPLWIGNTEQTTPYYLILLQVIIVGNVADQVKFSELTLDMFRMLQTLEREPQDEMNQVCAITTSRTAKVDNNKG